MIEESSASKRASDDFNPKEDSPPSCKDHENDQASEGVSTRLENQVLVDGRIQGSIKACVSESELITPWSSNLGGDPR